MIEQPMREPVGLRATLDAAMVDGELSMKDLTVLAPQNDPFRVDTPTGHRDGAWLAERFGELGRKQIHLRGLHYAVIGQEKPDGSAYGNTDADWVWLQSKAGKAARWLGYIPFEAITDERNSEPTVIPFHRPSAEAWISFGEVRVELPYDLEPRPLLWGLEGIQPYRLVLFGEKTSLEPVLSPVAASRDADLYLPTGSASDTMIYRLAKDGAEDGRPLVVFYFSDCDPSGWNMGIEVARKLQAFKARTFPDLDFKVRRVALTPDQVREYGLPSTPLKASEKRADAWTRAMGVEQTEIDAIATLKPELLREIAMEATAPFFDTTLARRSLELELQWREEAKQVLAEGLDDEQLARLRRDAQATLDELEDKRDELNEALRVDADGIELPEPPEVPWGEVDGAGGLPPSLIDSNWDFAEQTRRLKAHKSYEETT